MIVLPAGEGLWPRSRRDVRVVAGTLLSALLREDRPVEFTSLVRAAGIGARRTEEAVRRLERGGRLRRDADERVVAVAGLSLRPTEHSITFDGVRRWTWCAYDAVGILAALGEGGAVASSCRATGQPIDIRFSGPEPEATDVVVFFADVPVRSVVDDWCGLVGFFASESLGREWSRREGVAGSVEPVARAAEKGRAAWSELLERGTGR